MKSIKIVAIGMIVLAAGVTIVSCTKNIKDNQPQQNDFSNSTLAQVFVATVGANRNYVYMDGKALTGAALVSGGLFPSGAYAFSVPGGLRSFTVRDTLSTTTQVPLTFAENMQVGRNYTIFTYDTITSPKQVTVPTNIVTIRDSTTRLRFANFVYAPFALPSLDVYSWLKGANLYTNIATNSVTEFVPYPSRITDTLYVREAGTMNQIVKIILVGGLTATRNYTLVHRGSAPRSTYSGTITTSLFINY